MSFNLEEILKIEESTNGLFKQKSRTTISQRLSELVPKVFLARSLPEKEGQEAFIKLANTYTALRHDALESGARNSGHPLWASAAACESWIQSILMGDDDLAVIEGKVFDLICRPYKSKIRKSAAALIARDLSWQYFTKYKSASSWMIFANQEVTKLLQKECGATIPAAQDIALILKQAIHYIEYQSDAMIAHIEAMEAYRKAAESGIRLNFGGEIADYMNDSTYLGKFSK